jgi:hypothetical protein
MIHIKKMALSGTHEKTKKTCMWKGKMAIFSASYLIGTGHVLYKGKFGTLLLSFAIRFEQIHIIRNKNNLLY